MAISDALLATNDPSGRQQNVDASTARFWALIADAPTHMPSIMPLTAAVAPRFAARYPEAAIIFDNLHSMHDVVSDILASPLVARERKRAAILEAGARYRDRTSFTMTVDEWREMSSSMGVEQMGGAAMVKRP